MKKFSKSARLAQLVEHPLDVGRVTGSSPVSRTMITLAIETSCDETAVCLLETQIESEPKNGKNNSILNYKILGNIIHSQVELHQKYGGVFPIMAKREHAKNLVPLLEKLIKESKIPTSKIETKENEKQVIEILHEKESVLLENLLKSDLLLQKPHIDQIAVTRGPGLEPALWVGVNCARALSALWNIPIVAVNHMEGHIVGSFLDSVKIDRQKFHALREVTFPSLALLISGGHTELVLVKNIGEYEVVGRTKDDAVGEAFDKVARMLGLPYPGGLQISILAEKARMEEKDLENINKTITLPRPMIHSHDLDFSFSGLKTAVLYTLRDIMKDKNQIVSEDVKKEIAREFEDAVTDVLISKTEKALAKYAEKGQPIQSIILGGGVTANKHIRQAFDILAKRHSIPLYLPPDGVSGDNALMIALAGAFETALRQNEKTNEKISSNSTLKAHGNLSL